VSSLDDTHERLLAFRRDLSTFTERMAASLADLADRHAGLDNLWRDSFRVHYDAAWEPLVQTVESFRDHESPEYDRFLSDKIASLEDYLYGRA
jgi:hypothetical protein